MKDLILGTAGHIDHGKTALVKALSGIDCDTHPMEKLRGITINLGFSHLENESVSIGIIDVPGHRDFINTMISGAFGINFVLLVVAADEGIMPQTEEHLKIMELLGVSHGIVVLTKNDLVDSEILGLAEDELINFTKGTFLEKAPVIHVSSRTGEGIKELKDLIFSLGNSIIPRNSISFFRMYIDRIFSVKGYGTVVTGTSLGGSLNDEDRLYLVPGNQTLKIRRIEKHGESVHSVGPGSRVSVNLANLNKEDFKRGMIISEKSIIPSSMIDAELCVIHKSKSYHIWFNGIFLTGTFSSPARIHLLNKDTAEAGDTVLIQIHLSQAAPAVKGDRFILRNSSGDFTIGGGKIIDVYPLHHKRRPQKLIENLGMLSKGDIAGFIGSELKKNKLLVTPGTLSDLLFLPEQVILNSIEDLPPEIQFISKEQKAYFVLKHSVEKYENKILRNLESYHKKNPLDEYGRSREELLSIFGDFTASEGCVFLEIILDNLLRRELVRIENNTFVLGSHRINLTSSLQAEIDLVKEYFKNSGSRTPVVSEYRNWFEKNGISGERLKQIINLLISRGILTAADGTILYYGIVEECRYKLLTYLDKTDKPITVAEFRDLTAGNRKICLLLLNYFDSEGITERNGDYRNITEKGRVLAERYNLTTT